MSIALVVLVSLGILDAFAGSTAVGIDADPTNATPATAAGLQQGDWIQSVPLELPPAPAGTVPGLQVTLDPRAPDGLLGPSWRLDGFSRLERRGPTGGVWAPGDDASFWVDGEALLEVGTGYEPLHVDGRAFSYDSASDVWKAARDGWTWSYGEKSATNRCGVESLDESAVEGCPFPAPNVTAWLLTSVTDPWGNTITYRYGVQLDTGHTAGGAVVSWDESLFGLAASETFSYEHVPISIEYGPHQIDFFWEKRGDLYFSSRTGMLRVNRLRLASLEITSNGEKDAVYSFAYADSPTTELASISRESASGGLVRQLRVVSTAEQAEAYPDDEFDVDGGTFSSDLDRNLTLEVVANFDGDGLPDIARLSCGDEDEETGGCEATASVIPSVEEDAGTLADSERADGNFGAAWSIVNPYINYWTDHNWALVDVNRDGWTDIVAVSVTAGAVAAVSDGVGGYWETSLNLPSGVLDSAQFADLDGDGFVDIVHTHGLTGSLDAYRNLGAPPWFDPESRLALTIGLPAAECDEEAYEQDYPPQTVAVVPTGCTDPTAAAAFDVAIDECRMEHHLDFSGYMDCILAASADAVSTGAAACAEAKSTGFVWDDADAYVGSQLRFGDYNGDGIADVATAYYACWTDGSTAAEELCPEYDGSLPGVCPIADSAVSKVLFGDGRGGFVEAGYDAGQPFLTYATTGTSAPGYSGYYDDHFGPSAWPSWDGFGSVDLHGEGHPGIINSTYGDALDASLFFRADQGLRGTYAPLSAAPNSDGTLSEAAIDGLERLPGYALDIHQAPAASQLVADFDGDTLPDIFRRVSTTESELFVAPWSNPAHRVVGLYESWGGEVALSWTTSALSGANPNLPQVIPVIESVEDQDGLTSYEFSGGAYDGARNRFNGFAEVLAHRESGWTDQLRFAVDPMTAGSLVYQASYRPDTTLAALTYHRYATEDVDWTGWSTPWFAPEVRTCTYDVEAGFLVDGHLEQTVDVFGLISFCEGFGGATGFDPNEVAVKYGWTKAFNVEDVPYHYEEAIWDAGTTSPTGLGSVAVPWLPGIEPDVPGWPDSVGLPEGWAVPTEPEAPVGGGDTSTNYRVYIRDTSWDDDHYFVDEVYDHRLNATTADDVDTVYTRTWDATWNGSKLTEERVKDASGSTLRTVEYSAFDGFNHPTQVREWAKGGVFSRLWTYDYDTTGELRARTDPEGGEEVWTRNGCGLPTSYTDAGGRTEASEYDDGCRRTEREFLGSTETWTYDALNRVEQHTRATPDQATFTESWLRDDDFHLHAVGLGGYDLRSIHVVGEGWSGDGLDHRARARFLYLDRWGRPVREAACVLTEAVTSLTADGVCESGTEVWQARAWAMDGSLRMESAPYEAGDIAPTTWYYRDGLGRELYREEPAPIEPTTPEWVETATIYDYDGVEVVGPTGIDCTTTWDTIYTNTWCGGEYRGGVERDVLGRTIQTFDGAGTPTVITLDDYGRPVSTYVDVDVDVFGPGLMKPTTNFEYDDMDRVTRVTDAAAGVTETVYDPLGRPTSVTVGVGTEAQRETTYAYTAGYTVETDPNGAETIRQQDGFGRPLAEARGSHATVWSYDAMGDTVAVSERHGNVPDDVSYTTRYAYGTLGQVIEVVGPDGVASTFDYDGAGHLRGAVDADGVESGAEYAWSGQPIEAWKSEGSAGYTVATWSWRDDGRLDATTRGGIETSLSYDALGRRTGACVGRDGTSCAQSYTWGYDDADRVVSQAKGSDPATQFQYNALGWMTKQVNPDASYQTWRFDGVGRVREHRDEELAKSSYVYDSTGRVTSAREPGTGTWTYAYGDGVMPYVVTTTQPDTNVSTVAYDELGNVVEEDRADGSATVYTWRGGLLDEEEHYDGATAIARTVYEYDDAGRLWKTWGPMSGSTSTYVFERAYTAAGRLASITGPNDSTAYEYSVGLPVEEEVTGVYTRSVTYDGWGRPESSAIGTSDPRTTERAWDASGRLTDEWVADSVQDIHRSFGSYDQFGTPRSTSISIDGVTQATYALTTDTRGRVTEVCATTIGSWSGTLTYGYYKNDALKSVDAVLNGGSSIGLRYTRTGDDFFLTNVKNAAGTTLVAVSARNALGQIATMSGGGNTVTLVHDALGRTTSQKVQSGTPYLTRTWRYDARGRVDQVTEDGTTTGGLHTYDFEYDEPGWLTSESKDGTVTASYTYDDAGNRLTKTVGSTTTTYAYGPGNVLTSVNSATNTWNEYGEIEVDHRGYSIVHNVDGTELGLDDPSAATVVDFVRDPEGRPIGVDTSSSNLLRQLWGGAGDVPIAEWSTSGGGKLNLVVEGTAFGTVSSSGLSIAVSDPQGTLMRKGTTWKLRPDTFGAGVTGTTGERAWSGLEVLGTSPYQLAQHRLYDGETGRFSSADPIGLAGGMHRFVYAGNNPATWVDPTGLLQSQGSTFRAPEPTDGGAPTGGTDAVGPGFHPVPVDVYALYARFAVRHLLPDDRALAVWVLMRAKAETDPKWARTFAGVGPQADVNFPYGGSGIGEGGGEPAGHTTDKDRKVPIPDEAPRVGTPDDPDGDGFDVESDAPIQVVDQCAFQPLGWDIPDVHLSPKERAAVWAAGGFVLESLYLLGQGPIIDEFAAEQGAATSDFGHLLDRGSEQKEGFHAGRLAADGAAAIVGGVTLGAAAVNQTAGSSQTALLALGGAEGPAVANQVATDLRTLVLIGAGGSLMANGTIMMSQNNRGDVGASEGAGSKVGKQRDGTPRTNQAQNKQFNDATRGLTEAEKRSLHEEITGQDMTYAEIKALADEIKAGR